MDACNPLLQAHPTWARDEHEGRGIPTSLTPDSGRLAPSPLRARPRARPIWAGARGDTHSSARGTPRSRNADILTHLFLTKGEKVILRALMTPFLAILARGGESISPKQKDRTTMPISKKFETSLKILNVFQLVSLKLVFL